MIVPESVWKFENLKKAEARAALDKRERFEVSNFEKDLGFNLMKLSRELQKGTYKTSDYRRFFIYVPKLREIQALKFRDRVVQNCICNEVLRPFLEPRLIYDNAACRKGKGTHFAMARLTKFLSSHYRRYKTAGYILKIDIRKYFNSIDHSVLKKKLERMEDEVSRKMLYDIIDGYEYAPNKGVPMGNQTSQWFALYYLDSLDRIVKEKYRIKAYVRYMDDMVIIHRDREYLRKLLNELREYASEELKLDFNSKTQIVPLTQGVEFLGFRFFLSDTGKVVRLLRTSAKQRFKQNLKRIDYEYSTGRLSPERLQNKIMSYVGHMGHGDTFRLRKKYLTALRLKKLRY